MTARVAPATAFCDLRLPSFSSLHARVLHPIGSELPCPFAKPRSSWSSLGLDLTLYRASHHSRVLGM